MTVSISVLKARAARAARLAKALETSITRDVIADGGGDAALCEVDTAMAASSINALLEERLSAVDAEADRLRTERRDESRAYAAAARASAPRNAKADAVSVRLGLARLGA